MSRHAIKVVPIDPESRRAKHGREQRAAPRIDCRIPIELKVDGQPVTTQTRDLSATGTAVEYGGAVELGQVFQVSLVLPDDGDEIECAGLVRSFRPGSQGRIVGIEFHNLPPDQRRSVARYVRWVMSGQDVEQARGHWGSVADPGAASVVPAEDARTTLRWAPGFASLFQEIAAHIQENEQVFVPVDHHGLEEGQRLYLELHPPSSHVVVRALAEVTWIDSGAATCGVGLRVAGMTAMDRYLLRSMRGFFQDDAERYR